MSHVILNEFFFPFFIFFIAHFFKSNEVVYWQCYLVVTWLVLRETAAVSAQVLCTPYNHAPVYSVIQRYIGRVHVCLAVTCHLHSWQDDQDLLRATAVTQGWVTQAATNDFNMQPQTVMILLLVKCILLYNAWHQSTKCRIPMIVVVCICRLCEEYVCVCVRVGGLEG